MSAGRANRQIPPRIPMTTITLIPRVWDRFLLFLFGLAVAPCTCAGMLTNGGSFCRFNMRIHWARLRGWIGRRWWVVAAMLVTCGVNAGDPYVLPGSVVTTWDTFTHLNNPIFRTFPENCGIMVGSCRLKNGNVACMFGANPGLVLYVFSINPSHNPPWTIEEGPYVIPPFEVPGWHHGGLTGAFAEYTDGRYVLAGFGDFDISGDEPFRREYYLLTMSKSGGQPSLFIKFAQEHNPVLYGMSEIAYLPSDGKDPESFVVGAQDRFNVFNTGGGLLRSITRESLHLVHTPSSCQMDGNLEASDNGDLLTLNYDEMASGDCPNWRGVVCTRFDRYGKLKGSWGFGATLESAMPETGFNSFAQLANGDLYCSSLQANYLIGSSTPEPKNGHTFRHYVVRPPATMTQPVLYLSPTTLSFPQQMVNRSQSATVLVSNPGSAPLQINSVVLSGDTNVFEDRSPPTSTLQPGFCELRVPGSFEERAIEFTPHRSGLYHAKLTFNSGDPVNPVQSVDISGFAVPARFAMETLLETTNLWPKPTRVTGLALSADGNEAQLMLAVLTGDGTTRGRVTRLPILRDDSGGIVAINAAAATTLCDLPNYSTHALRLGTNGTLWFGPDSKFGPYLYQRNPLGEVITNAMHDQLLRAPIDLQFLPGQMSLLVARSEAYRLQQYDLVTNGGALTPVYKGDVGLSAPAYIRGFDLWFEGASVFFLGALANGELWLMQAPAESFGTSGGGSRPAAALLSPSTGIQAFGRDARSGDVLVLDESGRILRMRGYMDFLNPLNLFHPETSAGKIVFRWEAEAGKTYRVQAKSSLNDSAWVDVRDILASGTTVEFSEAVAGERERFFRVLLIK